MCKNQSSSKEIANNQLENARVGYQAAINLWIYQGGEIWARFNVMLVANSILIGVIGLNITNSSLLLIFPGILSLVGLLICIAWFLLMKRSNDYQLYFLNSARELEEKYLSNPVNTVSYGGNFGEGCGVKRIIAGNSKTLQMKKWSRFTTEEVSYFIIILFFLIYIISFCIILFQIYPPLKNSLQISIH